MLTELPAFTWVSLVGAMLLFIGPGAALLSLDTERERFDKTQAVAIAFSLSLSLWAVLLASLRVLNISLSSSAAIIFFVLSWLYVAVRSRKQWSRVAATLVPSRLGASRLVLWITLGLVGLVSVVVLRHSVAGTGSDGYHHSLIAHMIAEQGALPLDYEPYAPLLTFRYHFGFHALVAASMWLTGLPALIAMPVVGQLLMMVAALSVAFLTQAVSGSRQAAALSALFAGLVSVFPAFFVNWGRYTQLSGLVIMPVLLALVWDWFDQRRHWSRDLVVGLLMAGLLMTHYRMTLMAALGIMVLLTWRMVSQRYRLCAAVNVAARLASAGAIAMVLTSAWFWQLVRTGQQGYAVTLAADAPSVFSLSRLGSGVLAYPTNVVVIGLLVLTFVVGWWQRDTVVRPMTVWLAVLVVASFPRLLGHYLDPVSTSISLYVPGAVALGWGLKRAGDWLGSRRPAAEWGLWAGVALLALFGMKAIYSISDPTANYVASRDLRAMEWIRENTPPSARFMVNTFTFPFNPDYVLGSDAGTWLPLLARRSAVTAPMTYPMENVGTPDYSERILALHRLAGHLNSAEALALLEREGVTYIYVGERGGPIAVSELADSASFKLEYNDGPVYIFRFAPTTTVVR